MRTAIILIFVVVTGTGGEICLTHAMKLLGEVHDFRPRAIVSFVLRSLRVGWLWFGVLLMAASFFSFLAMLSWFPVSFVIPATSLAYVAGAFGAKLFLGEQLNGTRWAGIFLICLGVGMAWVDDLPASLHYPSAIMIARWAILALALGPLFYYLVGIYSAWRFFRVAHRGASQTLPGSENAPPISVLKPVRGLDPGAYENFASFCRQDYPEFEILFAVNDADDPAVPIVQKLIADFPARTIRLIVVAERLGPNTKVSNLCRLVREARHDLLVITDSDVRVEPGYLRSVAAMFRDPSVGGVTALYRGRDNLQFVAAMDCVGSSAAFCGAALVARELEGPEIHDGFDDGHDEGAARRNRWLRGHGGPALRRLRTRTPHRRTRLPDRTAGRAGLDGISLRNAGRVPAARIALGHRDPQHSAGRAFRHAVHARTSLGDRGGIGRANCRRRRSLCGCLFCVAVRDGLDRWRLGLARSCPAAAVMAVAPARLAFIFCLARQLWDEPNRVAGELLHTGKGTDDSSDAAGGTGLAKTFRQAL